jgi:outer membrane protein assembly factor BamB/ABC-type phosphate/phosphonate transport system substrate-binding protein
MIRAIVILASVVVGLSQVAVADQPLTMLVMDPLAAPLSCPCVAGHAQRKYDKLAEFLTKQLNRPVKAIFADDVGKALRGEAKGHVDLIIGKQSVVIFDAKERQMPIRPLAMLTGKDGTTTVTGLFVVLAKDPAKQVSDLKGYKVLFGPAESVEKHGAAIAALRAVGVDVPEKPDVRGGCSDAAIEMVEDKGKHKLAAVISSYAMPLLEGCKTVEKGALRMIGRTEPVPFVTVFATDGISEELGKRIQTALFSMFTDVELLKALESQRGFVAMPAAASPSPQSSNPSPLAPGVLPAPWPGWRGANRDAIVARLPEKLPVVPKWLWKQSLAGGAPAGVAATEKEVIVADRDASDLKDIFRCLDAATGVERWKLEYPAPGKLDYGNSPRATPLIQGRRVYLLGAFGDLHCVELADGAVVWKKNIVHEYKAKLVTWGMCSSPLVVDDRLIVNPGAAEASIVALDPATGSELWRCPGRPPAYSSFIVGRFGGVRQIVGYDAESLGGWDIETGRRLWTLIPPEKGDFNVPTPIALGGRLLLSSENNGTRLYAFDDRGVIRRTPVAVHEDLAPDASTPVVLGGKVFGCRGELFCLDAANLKTLWTSDDKAFCDYVSFIGGSDRILAATVRGELLLLAADADRCKLLSRMQLFKDGEMLSHPALVGNRLYLRGPDSVSCLLLD